MDALSFNDLQGNWISHQVLGYSDYYLGTSKKEGQIGSLEIKKDKYRKTISGRFYDFHLIKNLILLDTDNKPDTGYINKITTKNLIISFRDKLNYVQYIYEK